MDNQSKTDGKKIADKPLIALPGQRLATSKTPRMLTPSEIALLKLDLKMALAYKAER